MDTSLPNDTTPLEDPTDRRLLDTLQQAIPLVQRPFQTLAEQLALDPADVLRRLHNARQRGLFGRIAAIFDTHRLGYESALVACKYAPDDLDRAADIINQHPGVSHNYLRNAPYNVWYTLAVAPDSRLGLHKTARLLADLTGPIDYHVLPATRVFKIGLRLPLQHHADPAQVAKHPHTPQPLAQSAPADFLADAPLRQAVRALQQDLPIEPEPFDRAARSHGLAVEQLLAIGNDLLARGIMRRYAAVLRHRAIGFDVNCMTVWPVPPEQIERVGSTLARFAEVSHCYHRPTWPDWPYNIYAMIHCRTTSQCEDLIERMKAAVGIMDMQTAYTVKEYKKTRVEYFSPAFAEWEESH